MSKTRIYVSAHRIGQRIQGAANDFPIAVEEDQGGIWYARAVEIHGPSVVRYAPEAPNPAGARCWVETEAEVTPAPFTAAEAAAGMEEMVEVGRACADTIAYTFVGHASALTDATDKVNDALQSIGDAASKTLGALGKRATKGETS